MDESTVELDSFTANMIKKTRDYKEHFDKLLHSDDENDDDDTQEINENKNNEDAQEKQSSSESDDSDFDEELLNNCNYTNHVRKSISVLLDVRKSILPSTDEPINNDKTTRLNKRLEKLTHLYTDSEDIEEATNVLTENKMNINKDAQIEKESTEAPVHKGLKDRLNDIARFYFPIENVEVDTKPKTTTPGLQQTQNNNLKIFAKSDSSVLEKPKFIENLPRMASTTVTQQIVSNPKVSKPNQPEEKTINKVEISTKKNSVADLRKVFENKSKDNTQVKEIAPELLSLKDKRRLFEKAISDENKAAKSQYRKEAPPIKRLAKWEPITSEVKKTLVDVEIQSNSVSEHLQETENDNLDALPLEDDLSVKQNTFERINSECMSLCSDLASEIIQDVSQESDDDIPIIDENTHNNDFQVDHETSTHESIEKAFETIDNMDYSTEPSTHIDTLADITFSALDSTDQLQRSSTKVDLKQNSHCSSASQSSSIEELPIKPPRLYLYENDEPPAEPQAYDTRDPPPLRTISFYRKEKQGLNSPAPTSSTQPSTVIHLKQNLHTDHSVDIEEFRKKCNDRIASLKKDVSEHNRIASQASTALTLCLEHPDLTLSEGRIEAERLLLISAEIRNASLREINRLKNMIKCPEKYSEKLLNVSTKGTISIRNLKVPLRNEFVDSRAKGKVSSIFYFVCLIYNGPNVFISNLLNSEKCIDKDFLEFFSRNFLLTCQELNEDFSIRLQLFVLELSKEKPKKGTFSKKSLKLFGTNSLKRTAKSLVVTNSPIPTKSVIPLSTSFKSAGEVCLNLNSVLKPPPYYTIESHSLIAPFDGYLNMNVSLKVNHNLTAEGYFDMKDPVTSFWNLRWFVIDGSKLVFWRFKEDHTQNRTPLGAIELKHCINPSVSLLTSDQRQICGRANTFILVNIVPPSISNAYKLVNGGTITKPVPEMFFISSQAREDSEIFCGQINKLLRNIRVWETNAVRPYSSDEFNRLLLNNFS